MKVSVFGLGYVGCVCAGCLAQDGHEIIGVDIDSHKVDLINAGQSPVVEPGLQDLIHNAVSSRRLEATLDPVWAVMESEISLVCVGTPTSPQGTTDLRAIRNVSAQIGHALAAKTEWHGIAIRSTVPPGTTEKVVVPIIEQEAQKLEGQHFGVCVNPEFLREGVAVRDFYDPPFVLIGEFHPEAGDKIAELHETMDAPFIRTTVKVAEMVKYVSNAFHALKITFANEIGVLCNVLGVDSREVMDIVVQDTKLNVSAAYLKPGFAYGGSCLGKDLRELLKRAELCGTQVPLLRSIPESNEIHVCRVTELIEQAGVTRVGILGISFKSGTDDLRESPMVSVARELLDKGYTVLIYDPDVVPGRLTGANRAYMEAHLPGLPRLVCTSINEVLEQSEAVIVSHNHPHFLDGMRQLKCNQLLIDVERVVEPNQVGCQYESLV